VTAALDGARPRPLPRQAAARTSLSPSLRADSPFLPSPKFAVKWIDKLGSISRSPNPIASLSDPFVDHEQLPCDLIPHPKLRVRRLTPSAHTYTSTKAGPGDTQTRSAATEGLELILRSADHRLNTTTTLDLRRHDKAPNSLFVRAYNQQGRVISKYSLGGLFFERERSGSTCLRNIPERCDVPQKTKSVPVPLSVYYVNCDVDSPPFDTASESAPAAAPVAAASAPAAPVSAPQRCSHAKGSTKGCTGHLVGTGGS